MINKQKISYVLWAILAGFTGGIISNQLMTTESAFAEKEIQKRKVIVAEEIRIVDENGQARAILAVSKDRNGKVKIDFRLASSKSSIWLSAEDSGASLSLASASSSKRIHTGIRLHAREDSAKLNLSQGKKRLNQNDNIELSASRNETNIKLRDQDGKVRAVVGNLSLRDKKTGKAKKYPVSSVVLLDKKGQITGVAP